MCLANLDMKENKNSATKAHIIGIAHHISNRTEIKPSVNSPSVSEVKLEKKPTGLPGKTLHHGVHVNTLHSQAHHSHKNVRKMTRRPRPIRMFSLEARVCE